MGTFSDVLDFLTDHQKKPSLKFVIIISSLFVFFLVNNILGFSYHYAIDRKIESIQKLNNIIKDSVTDFETRKFAWRTRRELIERKDLVESMYEYIDSIFRTNKNLPNASINSNRSVIPRNNFIFHITSAGFFYLFAISFFILVLVTNSTATWGSRISMGLFSGVIFWCVGFFFYSVFGLIPLLSSTSWGWNYALNVALQFLVVAFITALIVYAVKKKNKEDSAQKSQGLDTILNKHKP